MDPIDGFAGIPFINDPHVEYDVRDAELDASTPLMPTPPDLPAGDIGAQVAAMVVMNAHRSKAAAQQLRKSELAMQRVAEDRQINVMHREAELEMAKAVIGAVSAGVQGVAAAAGCQSGADLARSMFQAPVGFIDAEAKYKEIDAKRYEQQAGHLKDAAEEAKDMVDDAKKHADKAIDFYSQWVQGKASATQAALHRS